MGVLTLLLLLNILSLFPSFASSLKHERKHTHTHKSNEIEIQETKMQCAASVVRAEPTPGGADA